LGVFFGEKQEKMLWQKRYNYELYKTFSEPYIINYIQVKRLAWAGHVARMKNDRLLKKIFNTKPEGVRSVGRPKLRWEIGVNQDMSESGRMPPTRHTNRHSFLRRPGPTKGCRANDDDGDDDDLEDTNDFEDIGLQDR
jgi:hypothetical protein